MPCPLDIRYTITFQAHADSRSMTWLKARTVSSSGTVGSGLCAKTMSTDGQFVQTVRYCQLTVVKTQVLEGDVQSLDNVLSRKTTGVLGLLSASTEENLGGDDNVPSVPSELLDDSAHFTLGLPSGLFCVVGSSNSPLRQSKPRRSVRQMRSKGCSGCRLGRMDTYVEHVDTWD